MRIQRIDLEPNQTFYKIKSKLKLKTTSKLFFDTLEGERLKISYEIKLNNKSKLNEYPNIINLRIEEPVDKKKIVLYGLVLEAENKIYNRLTQTYKHREGELNNIINDIELNYKKLNKDIDYNFYSDKDCIEFFKTFYDDSFVEVFNNINSGVIKADFFRLCCVYSFGGWYCDIDIKFYEPFSNLIDLRTDFLCVVGSSQQEVFNACFYSKPHSPILMECILRFLELEHKEIVYNIGPFKTCYDMLFAVKKEIYHQDPQKNIPHILLNGEYKNGKIKVIQEVLLGNDVYSWGICYNGLKVADSRTPNYDYRNHKFIKNDKHL